MTNQVAPLIRSQIPEFLQGSSPLLVDFMDLYYQYMDQRNKSGSQIQNAHIDSDIDLVGSEYLNRFYDTYGPQMPREVAMDRRNLLKLLNSIYEAKGTDKALALVFQALFGESINVTFPGENRLRASDGVWVREKFVTLVTRFGALPEENITLFISNETGDYTFDVTRIDVVDPTTTRCYFRSSTNIEFAVNQRCYMFDGNRNMIYAGDLVASPSFLSIRTPGTNWQVGQIIRIPGTDEDTIGRVTSINAQGGITGVEVVEYGHEHSDGQVIVVSPYPNKPQSDFVTVETVPVSISPPIFLHTLSVTEYVVGLTESVVGVSDAITPNSYFLEDYVVRDYSGSTVISRITTPAPSEVEVDTSLTIEEWLASRATLTFEYEDVVKLKGYYESEAGQISNQSIKLQDNYFYQAFSYLIETTRDISEYKNVLNVTHPAGTKRFSDLFKVGEIVETVIPDRTIEPGYSLV